MSSFATTAGDDSQNRKTVIILSAVLGSVGLLSIGMVVLVIYRCRRGKSPFGHRGASPINDDEIASWRQSGLEKKLTIPPPTHQPPTRGVSAVQIHSSRWKRTASPSSIPTVSANLSGPRVLAQAPNARLGLTDEAVPGADAFIIPSKRRSSRLSKLPPGHSRSKSSGSSMSGKSLWNLERTSSDYRQPKMSSPWSAFDDAIVSSHFEKAEHGSSSPGSSLFEETTGGLSPRPEPRMRPGERNVAPEEIGRAIS
ncbi:uncharacterized protein L3040_003301 [Drepanopeziza brunnea f. sp. 'multigermtubi']|nr:hypothetical protein L3040_003301 [Drepanopeziza brunnea f. sp. 'multigermtubi']